MKAKIHTLILVFLCSSFSLFAQDFAQQEAMKQSFDLVNTLTQNGIFFRYSTDTTFYFHTSENGSMDDLEANTVNYLPESDTGRLASIGFKFENISIFLTHMEDYFRLENTPEKEYGEFTATTLGISIKKRMFWIFYLIGGLDRTDSTFIITLPGESSEEDFKYSNYAGTVGIEAGYEMLEGVFVNLYVLNNQQLFETGFFKGYNSFGIGVEVFSTD